MNRVHIVPSCGHTDDNGKFDRGRCIDAISEYDIISKVIPAIEDGFDSRSVRFVTSPGLRSPGVRYSDRPELIDTNDLVLSIGVGWSSEDLDHNYTQIQYNGDRTAQILSQELSDVLTDWGSCAVFGHRAKLPRRNDKQAILSGPGIRVHLEPFALNGFEGLEYCRFLDRLGEDIAESISDFLKRKKSGAITQKYRLMSYEEPNSDLASVSLEAFQSGLLSDVLLPSRLGQPSEQPAAKRSASSQSRKGRTSKTRRTRKRS